MKMTTHNNKFAHTISIRDLCRVNSAKMLGIKMIGVVAKKKIRTSVGVIGDSWEFDRLVEVLN